MPRILSQEEIDAQFGGGFRADVAPAGLGTRFGAAIDRSQAGLLGIGEAVGLPLGDLRRENQFQQQESMQRYFRDNPNEPQSFRDVEGVGSALRFARGLAIDSSPELLTSLATGGAGALMGLSTAGRIGLAAAANYPSAVGDILQNQREEAGQTNAGVAGLLGVPYAAADLVGLDAALASGKMMRTGIKRLDEMRGFGGAAARTGANVAMNAPIEGASETFQELVNQAGRIAVNPNQTFFNPEANERYLESFVGGAALGGAASGVLGGWRRSEQYQAPQQETDLLSKQTQQTQQPAPQQYGLVTQPQPLQQRIDQQLGIGARTTPKDYAKQFEEAYNEPSGQFATDPVTGLEKQLTVGEYQQVANAALDLTQDKPAETAAAAAVAEKIERDPTDLFIRDTLKVIPNQHSRALFGLMMESGIDPQADIMVPVWNYASDKYMSKGRYDKAVQMMDEAIINARKGAPSGTGVSTVQQPAGGVGVGGAVVPGTVGTAGSNAPVTGTVAGSTATAGAPLQQAGLLPNAGGQPSTTVTDQPVDLTAAAPATKFRRAPKPMTVLEAANAAKAAQAQQTETQGSQVPAQPVVDERQVVLQQIFGERNGDIIFDVIGMGMSEPEAAAKYGLSRQAIQKIAGATGAETRAARVAKAKTELGLTDEQIQNAFTPPEQDVLGSAIEREIFGQAQPSSISETEAIEGGLENIVNTEGAGTSAVEGFTKLQKEIDATLEALQTETDEAKLEELNAKLAEQIVKVRAVEKRAQAEVRATAGKDTSTQVGEEDAVQVESTAGVPVQPETEAGQGVGRQVRGAEKPTDQGQTQVLTTAEQAAQAWDKVASEYPEAPAFADLTKAQQQDFIDFGPDNWTEEDVNTELTKLAKSGLKFGKDRVASQPYTAVELTADIQGFIRADVTGRKLIIVDSIEDLLNSGTPLEQRLGAAIEKKGAYGVAANGVAYLVANRIQKGQGRAKFMHEVGAHLGLENLLPKVVYNRLVDQLETWAESGKDSLEAKLAAKAKARVGYAKTPTVDEREELLAYFVEEAMLAGVDPTAMGKESGPLLAWFRTLWAAFKIAVRKLGFKPEALSAQDVVNLAFGAARLEMNGSWHGTAATFRRFNHAFMNSGEGAQAYGWGTYLAQAVGIGKGYWQADVERKLQDRLPQAFFDGRPIAEIEAELQAKDRLTADEDHLRSVIWQISHEINQGNTDAVRTVNRNIAKLAAPSKPEFAQRFKPVSDWLDKNFNRFTVEASPAPEGNLMRLDTAVSDSDTLDWDASFADQPKVVIDFVKGEAATIKDLNDNKGANIRIKTGEDVYRYLVARFWNESGQTQSWKDASPEARMNAKKQASKYLESKGIQGIRFYDANSRENTIDNISFTKDGKTIRGREGVLKAYFTPGEIVFGNGWADKVLDLEYDPQDAMGGVRVRVVAVDGDGNPRRDSRPRVHTTMPTANDVAMVMRMRGYEVGETNRTRNLVIFNEKNIFRAGSEAAADKQRMKFGFGGVEATGAKTFERRIELVQAQLDTANGVDPETIWKETGWYKGTDNKWRFEFDDSQAKFKQDFKDIDLYTEFKLSDVLDHPELFAQYPELKDVTFEKRKVMMDVWGSTQGWFDPKTKKLVVTPYARDPLSTVLHEVQHWIQSKEKFENGSSPQGSDLSNKAALTKLRNELQKAIDAYDASELESQARKARGERYSSNFDKFVEKNRAADLMGAVDALLANTAELAPMYSKVRALDSEVTRLETAKGVLEKKFKEENKKVNVLKRVANYAEQMKEIRFYSDKIKTISDEHYAANKELKARVVELTDGKDVAHELYRLVAGEAEARNVQSRMGMSFEERVKSFPAATMDVSPENTLTSTGRGGAYLSQERMKFGVNAPTQGTIQRNIAKLPKTAQQPVRNSLGAIGDAVNKSLDYVVFTSDLVNRATASGIGSAKKFVDLIGKSKSEARENEIAVEKISDMYALVPEKDRGTGENSVNRFLFDSTREGKWGYGKYRDDAMGDRFDALSDESQAYVQAVFAHGSDVLAKKKKIVLDSTNSEYDAMIAAARLDGDAAGEAKLIKEKAATLKRFQTLFKLRDGIPYAPIKRNGSHVVIAKSQAYLDAEAANDRKKITELESDSDHYHVSFTDGKWEARTLRDELNDQGFFSDVQIAERDNVIDEMFSGHSALRELTKMRSKVDAQAADGDKSASKMLSLISQMYLEALAEGSARKSEMRRRGVAGEVDMIRSFAQQGRADAHFMASVKYNPQVQDALQEMRNQAKKGDRERKSEIFNELAKRYTQSMDYNERPWLNKLTRMSSLYYLATSPAYYLQNLTQPWMMSVPAMAGKYNYAQASGALFKAYTELGGVMKSAKLLKQQFDFDKVPTDVRDAIKELVNRGKIDIGLDTEMGEFKVEGDSYFAGKISAADRALRLAVQKVESINRLSTAMAAYRLELAKNGSKEDAINYADRILTETHGDYTSFNAPRAFNTGVGKVALQFRKFQLIQLSFYAKLIKDALSGADRAAALKTLAYSLSHTGLLAGAMGLPGYSAIAWAINALLSDEDDKYDLTNELRKAIGDEQVANLIMRGAPTLVGADISGKVGAGNMLSIMPFSQADLTTTAGRFEAFGALVGGAAGGMASRMIDGLLLMSSGDWYRGIEMTMPKGVSDAMKAYRIANEGMTRRNGDIVLPPDEVSSLDTVFQAIGIQPVKQTVTYERQTLMKETTQNFTERTTRIKNDYVKAARAGDTEAQAEAREAWKKLQDVKRREGVNVSPLSDLLKAPAEQRKREKMTVGGVQYTKGTRKLAEEIAED